MVHCFERHERQSTVDCHLSEGRVLNAVRPPPQNLSDSQRLEVVNLRLGKEDDIAFLDQLGASANPSTRTGDAGIGNSEGLAVTGLEVDPGSDVLGDTIEVKWMNREAAFVRLR